MANRLIDYLERFFALRVAVLGDLMLDRYIFGKASRISQEAPVPVVQVKTINAVPGGAANVARNVLSLGGQAECLGVVGDDATGQELKQLLVQDGVGVSAVCVEPSRKTTLKTRVIANTQQVVRVDSEDVCCLTADTQQMLLGQLQTLLERQTIDAVIFEDYAKGVFSHDFLEKAIALATAAGKPTALDPHPSNVFNVKGLTLMTPNRAEAFLLAGVPYVSGIGNPLEDEPLCRVGALILDKWECEYLLITLGAEGMAMFSRKQTKPWHIPTMARQVFDVSGAGDTVMATITLAMLAGASPEDAAIIANHAAGIVVGMVGTAAVPLEELKKSLLAI